MMCGRVILIALATAMCAVGGSRARFPSRLHRLQSPDGKAAFLWAPGKQPNEKLLLLYQGDKEEPLLSFERDVTVWWLSDSRHAVIVNDAGSAESELYLLDRVSGLCVNPTPWIWTQVAPEASEKLNHGYVELIAVKGQRLRLSIAGYGNGIRIDCHRTFNYGELFNHGTPMKLLTNR